MKSKKINSKPASITDISSKGSISNLRIPSSSVISGPLPSASGGVYYNIPYVEEASGDTLRIDPKKVLEDIIKSEDTRACGGYEIGLELSSRLLRENYGFS